MKRNIFKNRTGTIIASVILGLLEVVALGMFYKDSIFLFGKSAVGVLCAAGLWVIFSILYFAVFILLPKGINMLKRPAGAGFREENMADASGHRSDTSAEFLTESAGTSRCYTSAEFLTENSGTSPSDTSAESLTESAGTSLCYSSAESLAEPATDTETADVRVITLNSTGLIPVNQKPSGIKASFLKHPWLWAAGLMLLFWLPWVIAFYPGSITYDMVYQLAQFDGALKLNAHHPPFATWVMGGMVSIGRLIMGGDTGLGLFLYIIVQTVACAASFAYSIRVLVRRGTGLKFIVVTLAFFCLTPLWGSLMQLGSKDLIFTALFVWFMTLSSEILLGNAGAKKLIFWALSLIGCCLYRNGIIIVMVPTVAVMWVSVLKNHVGKGRALSGKKLLKSFTAAALAALAVAVIFGSVMTSVLKLKTETGEALSIPFQQTARFVRDFPEDLSEEDIEILEKTFMVKDYTVIGKKYLPPCSDPVKALYAMWAADNEGDYLKDYLGVWWRGFLKHPLSYVEATIANSYGYYAIAPQLTVKANGTITQFEVDHYLEDWVKEEHPDFAGYGLRQAETLSGLRGFLQGWFELFDSVPPFLLLQRCGPWAIALLAVVMAAVRNLRLKKKAGCGAASGKPAIGAASAPGVGYETTAAASGARTSLILLCVPLFLMILVCIASPVNEHIRYLLPVIASLPLYVGSIE